MTGTWHDFLGRENASPLHGGDALKRTQWNKTHASQEPGISRASLNNKIAEFDIQSNNPTSEDGV